MVAKAEGKMYLGRGKCGGKLKIRNEALPRDAEEEVSACELSGS
jgi:hypothetical protein